MKKYIAPEVEIKRFAVENIMTDSTAEAKEVDAFAADTVVGDAVNYGDLFKLN